jgi:hypothetical protein
MCIFCIQFSPLFKLVWILWWMYLLQTDEVLWVFNSCCYTQQLGLGFVQKQCISFPWMYFENFCETLVMCKFLMLCCQMSDVLGVIKIHWNLDSLFLSGCLKKEDWYGKTVDVGAYINLIKRWEFSICIYYIKKCTQIMLLWTLQWTQ